LVTSLTFQFWDPLNIYGMAKATKIPKVVNGDDVISGQSLHRGSAAERIVGGRVGREVRGLSPETTHLHTCQSILLAILFKNVLKMLKISQSYYSLILPFTSMRPVTATRYQISATGREKYEGDDTHRGV